MAALALSRLLPGAGTVPFAWRNLIANRRRLLRSAAGIAFAVLLMMVQLGFERGFFDASLSAVRALDGDLFVSTAAKYRFGTRDPFPHKDLDTIRSVYGVASAAPFYASWQEVFWTSPQDGKAYLVRVFAVDPDGPPVFLPSEIAGQQALLKGDNAVLVDRRSRGFLGMADNPTQAELNGQRVQVVGSFALGPDFMSDGTVIISDRLFAKLLPGNREPAGALPVETAVIKIRSGDAPAAVANALRNTLPASLTVMTKAELVEFERQFHAKLSSAAPIFWLGTIVGFVVGMLISYQIIYTDLSDQLPQYATLRGIGYDTPYLIRMVLRQAALTACAGYVPAWLLCVIAFRVIGAIALLPLHMTIDLTLLTFVLTLGMCLLAGMLAVRRVITADPAEIF